jgi:hypothetical protein
MPRRWCTRSVGRYRPHRRARNRRRNIRDAIPPPSFEGHDQFKKTHENYQSARKGRVGTARQTRNVPMRAGSRRFYFGTANACFWWRDFDLDDLGFGANMMAPKCFAQLPKERRNSARASCYALMKANSVPLAAAGATQTALPLPTAELPTALFAAARSDVASTRPAPPRSGSPASETSG